MCNCILWSCFTGENRTKPMQFIPISVVPQTDSGGAKAHYITQRGETAEISEINLNTSEKHSHAGQLMEMRRKRTSQEREKNQRCHLALNVGKENADRNKLSDSSGPLRETDRREMVCTEVQEDVKQGADGWMERGRNRGPNTKENKSSEFPPMSA